jgi:hypothetical protein
MLSKKFLKIIIAAVVLFHTGKLYSQQADTDSSWKNTRKNVIRYNVSGSLLFGFDKYAIFGYERVINHHQSISINLGPVALPKLISISTDSFSLQKDTKNNGFNASIDYRFYLAKENKYYPPHGVYIGPYISYNHFDRGNAWTFQQSGTENSITTDTKLSIFTGGFELGYQFIFWKRLALDMVLIGPGLANYNIKATYQTDINLTDEQRKNLQQAVEQLITQKFPGMNYVLADKEFNANGTLGTTSIGFRYLVNIGFNF